MQNVSNIYKMYKHDTITTPFILSVSTMMSATNYQIYLTGQHYNVILVAQSFVFNVVFVNWLLSDRSSFFCNDAVNLFSTYKFWIYSFLIVEGRDLHVKLLLSVSCWSLLESFLIDNNTISSFFIRYTSPFFFRHFILSFVLMFPQHLLIAL